MAPADSLSPVGGPTAPNSQAPAVAKPAVGAPADSKTERALPGAATGPKADRLAPSDEGQISMSARKLAKPDIKESQPKADPKPEYQTKSGSSLRFQVNSDDGSVTITIIDPDTKEVVRTIPPDELKKMGYDHFLNLFT
ncbi:MAG: hypothetical protein DWG81_00205 [Chloroflexi bacterium]|nr:flagellar protein FlaG [Chloroflexota bacterium]MQC24352.1 hypothetical protein [Chloroflexota bacterium]